MLDQNSDLWDAKDVQEFALAAKRKGDLQDDDIDLAPHDSDDSDDEEDVGGIDLGVVVNYLKSNYSKQT